MRQFGLIGQTLKHSYSKLLFEQKFVEKHLIDCHYELYELQHIEDFPIFIHNHPLIKGLNVTIPFKKEIIPYLNEIEPAAEAIGAVNVIRIDQKEGKPYLLGYNTDYIGFRDSLTEKEIPADALILGTGGAAAAVAFALEMLHIHYRFVSRKEGKSHLLYQELTKEIIQRNPFIINCTPIGMYPKSEEAPVIPYDGISVQHILYDLIYNPAITKFMKEGIARGARVENGRLMLSLQAQAAEKIWNL